MALAIREAEEAAKLAEETRLALAAKEAEEAAAAEAAETAAKAAAAQQIEAPAPRKQKATAVSTDMAQTTAAQEPEVCRAPCPGQELEVCRAPRKQIEKSKTSWAAEEGQLKITEGQFVRVWAESMTELGWIYAEALDSSGAVGWIPNFVIDQPLPEKQRWMLAKKVGTPKLRDTGRRDSWHST